MKVLIIYTLKTVDKWLHVYPLGEDAKHNLGDVNAHYACPCVPRWVDGPRVIEHRKVTGVSDYELTKIQEKCQFVVYRRTGTYFVLKRLDEILEKGAMSFVIHKGSPVIIKEDGTSETLDA